jgi:FkbM family methyltransferase
MARGESMGLARVKLFAKRAVRGAFKEVHWIEIQLKSGEIDKGTYYDKLTELVMRRVLTPTAVCIDIGCHAGSILRLMMKYAPNGRFLAFEPLPQFYEKLLRDFDASKVHVYDLALSDSVGTSSFNYVVSNPGYSGLKKRRYDRVDEIDRSIEVRTDLLDNVIARENIGRVAFIKIDVEGAEYLVMKGAESTIRKDKPVIVFEHGLGGSEYYGTRPEDVFSFLCDICGLRISLLSDFLFRKASLESSAFCEQFYKGKNYQFIAHK